MSFHGDNLDPLGDEKSWDPRFGYSIRRGWKGTPTAIAIKIAALEAANVRYDHRIPPGGGYQEVWAHLGAQDSQPVDEPLTDEWSMPNEDIERDLWQHPKVATIFADLLDGSGFPTDTSIAVRRDIEDLLSGEKTVSDVTWWSGASTNTKKFVGALIRGVEVYPISVFVVRNTKIVAENYNVAPAYEHANKILSKAELESEYTPPATIKFALPDGWYLEKTPKVEPAGVGKWAIIREWIHTEEYDEFVHDRATVS